MEGQRWSFALSRFCQVLLHTHHSPVPSNPPPLTEGHLHGSSQRAYILSSSVLLGTFSQVRYILEEACCENRRSPLRLSAECLLSGSAQRVSSPARPRGPPLVHWRPQPGGEGGATAMPSPRSFEWVRIRTTKPTYPQNLLSPRISAT